MGDFFLPQMDDFFAESVCFDNRKEGEGAAPIPRSPIMRRSAQTCPCAIGPELSAIRAAAARHGFYALDLIAHGFVEDSVAQEDQPVRAGVRVVVLTGFPWTEYARLCGVHKTSPYGPGSGVLQHRRGHLFIYP
jgi:hypothetical protein